MNVNDDISPLAYSSGRLTHAYIVRGSTAETIAMAVVCEGNAERPCRQCPHCSKAARGIHPDIVYISRLAKKRDILVDQIRELRKDAIRVPSEASAKVYIINDADTMNAAAQNALLRILEDPPGNTVFILRTDNPKVLLPTVRSRCVELITTDTEEAERSKASGGVPADTSDDAADAAAGAASGDEADLADSFLRAITGGNEQLIRLMFRLDKLDKRELAVFLTFTQEKTMRRLRDSVSGGASDNAAFLDVLEQADRALNRAVELLNLNVNTGHISGMLCSIFMK